MEEAKYFYMATDTIDRDDCEYLSNIFNEPQKIGKGAYGEVYQICNKTNQNCNYALKVIIYDKIRYEMSGVELLSRATIKDLWFREVRILKKLNRCQEKQGYKFVPDIYDNWFCTKPEQTYFYILMEKFDGNLSQFIKKYRSVELVKIASLLALKSLDKDLKIIHTFCDICLNDIKLDNILYKQVGEYNYQFVFADTGNSSEEVSQKCQDDDQARFRKTIEEFEKEL